MKRSAPVDSIVIVFELNGAPCSVCVPTCASVLDVLRDDLGLRGTKRGCNLGACGACTVLLNGRPINACLMLAAQADGQSITSIEGLARDGELHPLQRAFIDHDALQCGFCTPGQIMSAVGLLSESGAPTVEVVRAGMSGNICRCGAYPNIVDAILDVAG